FFLLLAVAAVLQSVPGWLCVLIGVMSGLINVPLMATYQAGLPADARGNGMAALNMAGYACMSFLALLLAGLAHGQVLSQGGRLWLLVVLAGGGAIVAWWALLRGAYALGLD